MKNASIKLLALIFLFTLAIVPLWAQTTNTPAETGTPDITAAAAGHVDSANNYSKEVEIKKIQAEKDIASNRLENERHLVNEIIGNLWIPFVCVIFFLGHRQRKMTHDTLRVMIEKGAPITPELVASVKSLNARGQLNRDLRAGVILVAVGVGIVAMDGDRAAWIVLFLGAAFLFFGISEFFLTKKNNNGQPSK